MNYNFTRFFRKKNRYFYLKFFIGVSFLYALTLIPIFFMYPNHDRMVDKHIDESYFINLAQSVDGDCYRITHNFIAICPFPTREIHLNSEHTILEININKKWFAFDPCYKRFFNNLNAMEISIDVRRGFIPDYLKNYPYAQSFHEVYYYHNLYFVLLKKICPFYNKIMANYYTI